MNFNEKNDVDTELDRVHSWFIEQTNFADRMINAIRTGLDEVIDGPRTGRFTYDQLEKTEKTYLGTKIEILVRSEFALSKGQTMDYSVNGVDVDCKYTGSNWGWNIPKEALGHICLLIRANDKKGLASVGLVRIKEEVLNPGKNQDLKGTISQEGRNTIRWLFVDSPMQINQLYLWPEEVISQIWSKGSGQQRLNELFRLRQGELINRQTIETVAQAKNDPMKRVRTNGGSRSYLSKEGIIILGHQKKHPTICRQLGIPVPVKGQVIAIRLVKCIDGSVTIDDCKWRMANENDPHSIAPKNY